MGDYVKCISCNHAYKIRFNIGGKFPQTAMFNCKTCGENLTYGYAEDRKKVLQNLALIEHDINLTVINLHPELPIDQNLESDPYYFPSMDFIREQIGKGDNGFIEMRIMQSSLTQYIES